MSPIVFFLLILIRTLYSYMCVLFSATAVPLCYVEGQQSSPMGDTDKSPSLTRLLGVSTPLLLLLLLLLLLSVRPMTPSSKPLHDMLIRELLAVFFLDAVRPTEAWNALPLGAATSAITARSVA